MFIIRTRWLWCCLTLFCFSSLQARTRVVAHRGASGYIVEHSAPAVAMAAAMNADYIEPDVVMTREGTLVVHHDIYVDINSDVREKFPQRCRKNGRYYVVDFSLAELKTLRFHERFRSDEKPNRFPQNSMSFEILSLQEWLDLVHGLGVSMGRQIGKIFEIKSAKFHRIAGLDMVKEFARFIQKNNLNDSSHQIFLESFEPEVLIELKYHYGIKTNLVQLMGLASDWLSIQESPPADYEQMKTKLGLQAVKKYAVGIAPSISMLYRTQKGGSVRSTGLSGLAQNLGLFVIPYTVRRDDLPQGFKSLDQLHGFLMKEEKVFAFFTDFPDLADNFRRQNNL